MDISVPTSPHPSAAPCLPASILLRSGFSPPTVSSSRILSLSSTASPFLSAPCLVLRRLSFLIGVTVRLLSTPPLPPSSSLRILYPPPSPLHPWQKKTGFRQTAYRLCTSSFPMCVCVFFTWFGLCVLGAPRLLIPVQHVPVVMSPSL